MKTTKIIGIVFGIMAAGLLVGCASVQEKFESAVHRNDLGGAEKWLARGATVNPKRKYEWQYSLLDNVIMDLKRYEEMVHWLLEHGATDSNGAVPWEAISMTGNPELLRMRLEKGADVNEKTMKSGCGWKPFGLATGGAERRNVLSNRSNTCMSMG